MTTAPRDSNDDENTGAPGQGHSLDDGSVAEHLLDLFVFAPAGIALTFVEELPKFVEKGKTRIEGQTATARMIGQFVVQVGRSEIEKRAKKLVATQKPAKKPAATRTKTQTQGSSTASGTPSPRSEDQRGAAQRKAAEQGDTALAPPTNAGVPPAGPDAATRNGFADSVDLAIPAYDTLSASQVVKRLAGLSHDELVEVGDHERSHRHRATILNRVEQLLSGEPEPETHAPPEPEEPFSQSTESVEPQGDERVFDTSGGSFNGNGNGHALSEDPQ